MLFYCQEKIYVAKIDQIIETETKITKHGILQGNSIEMANKII
jgi:hypothetical protein